MNYILYGADTFRSRRKLREIIDAYRAASGGAFNLHRLDAEDDDLATLAALASGQSLFESKKFIVVERPFTALRQIMHVREAMTRSYGDKATVVALWDMELGGEAKKLAVGMEKLADKIQVFDPLAGEKLARWAREEAKTRNLYLSKGEIARLIEASGGDLWMLASEMDKTALGAPAAAVSATAGGSVTVFQLGDALFASPRDALRIMHELIAQGEDEMRMLAYLAGHVRTLLVVKAAAEKGQPPAAPHGIHPFVAKKASRTAAPLTREYLARTLASFLEEDVKIKTGLTRPDESLVRLLMSLSPRGS